MDPSYNNNIGGFGSGGQFQPQRPQQPVTPQQPMMPKQTTIQQQSVAPQQPVPIGSGVGDIVLTQNKKSHKKLGLIIAIIFGVVGAIALIVVMLSKNGVVEIIPTNTGLRGAFNQYANYFLSGETSTKDIEDVNEDSADVLSNEDSSGSEGLNDDQIEVDATGLDDLYFYKMMYSEDKKQYIDNLWKYFDSFKDYYENDTDGDMDDNSSFSINEYEKELKVVIANYDVGVLLEGELANIYVENGEEALREAIDPVVNAYAGLNDIYGVDLYDLFVDYGEKVIFLIKKYNEYGCISGGEINSGCTNTINDNTVLEVEVNITNDRNAIISTINKCRTDIYTDIYSFASIIYEEGENDDPEEE